ncbi:ABC transporter ATP-binding protein [soil metagenome]
MVAPSSSPNGASSTGALLGVKDLRVSFQVSREKAVEAVKGISFEIGRNRTVALVGESGSGKSVTAMSILRLLPENAIVAPGSQIVYAGRNLIDQPASTLRSLRGHDIAMVFQDPMSSLNPVLTVGDQIAETLKLHLDLSGSEAWKRAGELLGEVGLPDPVQRLRAYPHELSGGQQQRVMIAMAIACEPKLLIADEPTTALDVTVQRQILDLLAKLQQKHHMSLLFISHDLGVVGEIADDVIVMRNGVIVEAGDVDTIFGNPKDPYTKALLACRPRVDERPQRLPVVDDFMSGREIHTTMRPVRPSEGAPLIEAIGLSKDYQVKTGLFGRKTFSAVKDVSFKLHKGRTLGVVGESGSGKTTVGMLVMRLVEATQGQVLFDGADLVKLDERALMKYRRRIQVIFQNPYASLNPRFTVGQILLEPMRIHSIGANDDERLTMAVALVERVGLPREAIHKYPHEFSGGQRQRIAIARCLTMRPDVLICDESVSALDVSVQATVLNLLMDLQDEFGMSYIFISHDLAVVRTMADDILVMNQGEVVERGSSDQIYESPQHPYTKRLLGSIPKGHVMAAAA